MCGIYVHIQIHKNIYRKRERERERERERREKKQDWRREEEEANLFLLLHSLLATELGTKTSIGKRSVRAS